MTAQTRVATPQGSFEVLRLPHSDKSTLQAWDAADEYVLEHLAEADISAVGGRWAVLNDAFGVLAVALADKHPLSISDSVIAHRATAANLERNGLRLDHVELVPSTTSTDEPVDVLVVKVPKTLALLEDQLHRIRPLLHAGSVIVGAGMTKGIHTSTLGLFEDLIGPTTTSLARRKARLIFATVDPDAQPGPSPYPTTFQLESGHTVVNHANVFSRGRLDIGTRLLLDHLPIELGTAAVADLGCGNGVVGLTLALTNPEIHVLLVDSSYMAVASAEATMSAAFGEDRQWIATVGDGLEMCGDATLDLVVVNPPFHEDRSRSEQVAWDMFTDAHRVLCAGGRLIVVGNRHLGYHAKLGRRFGKGAVSLVASNPKFVVLSATR